MIFKSSAVAILVSALLSNSANAVVNNGKLDSANTDSVSSHLANTNEELGVYNITLAQAGAIDSKYAVYGAGRSAVINEITEQQTQLIASIQAEDPNAIVTRQLRIVTSMLTMQMSKATADKVRHFSDVDSVIKDENATLVEANSLAAKESPYRYLKVNDPGDNPVVALIGQGVDYTHAQLGGSGKQADYVTAYYDRDAVSDLFPNQTVIGGFDFSSSRGGFDYNPIEFFADIEIEVDGVEYGYQAGVGTVTASMILNAAPSAKILSYKVHGVNNSGSGILRESKESLYEAFEMVMDPNLDGDMSDAADILLLDVNTLGWLGFWDENHTGGSLDIKILRAIAATGTLVVTPAGDNGQFETYYSVAPRGMVPEGISVGFVDKDVDNVGEYIINEHSPIGPNRGQSNIKPEVVALSSDAYGAIINSGNYSDKVEPNNLYGAARVAGVAANLMKRYPQLNAHEIKAMITNTGEYDVANAWGIAQLGGGRLNPVAANGTPVLMYDKATLQPTINLGQVAVQGEAGFTKELVIKNVSDKEETYYLSNVIHDAKSVEDSYRPNNAAISVLMPSHVTIPANSEITVGVTFNIDGSKLSPISIQESADYTLENWDQYALDGYIQFSHERSKTKNIQMPWLAMPNQTSPFSVDMETSVFDTFFKKETYDKIGIEERVPPFRSDWKNATYFDITQSYNQVDIKNESSVAQELYAMPTIYYSASKPADKVNSGGNIIKAVSGGVYPQEQCSVSNKQLSVAVTMFEPMQVPVSKYMDRIGEKLVVLKLYNQEALLAADNVYPQEGSIVNSQLRYKTPVELAAVRNEQQRITELFVSFDSIDEGEDGLRDGIDDSLKPLTLETFYIDYKYAYDLDAPQKRLKTSTLPTIVSPGGDTVIMNICLEDLYHGPHIGYGVTPIESDFTINEQTFNENIGFQFITDRQSLPTIGDNLLIHNFKYGGLFEQELDNALDEEIIEDICEDEDYSEDFIEVHDSNGNCIREFTENQPIVSLPIYFGLSETSFTNFCDIKTLSPLRYTCTVTHPRFVEDISFTSPVGAPWPGGEGPTTANLMCNLPKESTYATCYPDNLKGEHSQTDYIKMIEFADVLKAPIKQTMFGEGNYSLLTGSVIKIAHADDSKDADELTWQDKLTVAPGERATVAQLVQEECGGQIVDLGLDNCIGKSSVFSPASGYFKFLDWNAPLPTIKDNQSFTISEDAQNGDFVGQVQFGGDRLQQSKNSRMRLMSSDVGAPFQMDEFGVITVRDASILNYEAKTQYQIKIQAYMNYLNGDITTVNIGLSNANDNAPQQVSGLPVIAAKVGQEIESVSLASHFTDLDGGKIIFSSNELPAGLSLSQAGTLSGTPNVAGQFFSTLLVSDDIHTYQASLELNITNENSEAEEERNSSSSGGSTSFTFILLMILASQRRLAQRLKKSA
ncbi:Fn3-like domain-containing protein [Thalassotalea nanhaiensis]|uniref:Fn3-like domain-containing protein n=1 Tax=Thalassotalea nanhaiensis TaxID=3065648 RepID=A0ABY9TEZ7_9GAMM|nr:Fn3-like domain-containing protein [Colwelliaceae bacterium SQ345]